MIIKACALGLLCAVCAQLLGEGGFKGKRFFSVLCIVCMTALVGDGVTYLVTELEGFIGTDVTDVASCALKIVGAGYVFGVSADIAAELGEGGVSKALTCVGRVQMLLISFPYFKKLFELGVGLIK